MLRCPVGILCRSCRSLVLVCGNGRILSSWNCYTYGTINAFKHGTTLWYRYLDYNELEISLYYQPYSYFRKSVCIDDRFRSYCAPDSFSSLHLGIQLNIGNISWSVQSNQFGPLYALLLIYWVIYNVFLKKIYISFFLIADLCISLNSTIQMWIKSEINVIEPCMTK